jgi:hypothetical protein
MMRDRSKLMPDAGIEHACDLRLSCARLGDEHVVGAPKAIRLAAPGVEYLSGFRL